MLRSFASTLIAVSVIFAFTERSLAVDCASDVDAYWSLDETSGTTFADFHGVNDATCSDCPSAVTGQIDGGQLFTATGNLEVADASSLDVPENGSFSFEAWVKPGADTTGLQVLMGQSNGQPCGTSPSQRWLGLEGGRPWFFVRPRSVGAANPNLKATAALTAGVWSHVVGVFNGTAKTIALYVNGAVPGTTGLSTFTGTPGTPWFDYGATQGFDLGRLQPCTSPVSTFNFKGSLDAVAVYNRALTAGEVKELYDIGKVLVEPICGATPTAPVFTSTCGTSADADTAYTCDVNAVGIPTATYSLVTFPSGMTINATTGIISWTPTALQVGLNNVTVRASNSEGDTDQSFMITVEQPPEPGPCHPDLVAYYPMDDDATTEFLGMNDAMCADCPTGTTGQIGGAQQITASNDVMVLDASDFDRLDGQSFSFEAWIKHANPAGIAKLEVIMGQSNGSPCVSNPSQRWLGLDPTGKPRFFVRAQSGAGFASIISTTAITAGTWNHLVGTVNGATKTATLYVNGTSKGSAMYAGTGGFQYGATQGFDIGRLQECTTTTFEYTGVLDAVAIYDDALTGTEVTDLYNLGLAGDPVCQLDCPAISIQPQGVDACAGDTVILSVDTTGGTPEGYQWKKGGTNVTNGGKFAGATTDTLTITGISAAEAGSYTVEITTTDCPTLTSSAAAVTVAAPPVITTQPGNVTACVGDEVVLSVAATGDGLTYQWKKGGVDIGGATSATLTIPSAATTDAGSYTVEITGCDVVESNPATVTINDPVTITADPVGDTVCEGDLVTLSVTATGTAPITYQWRKGGVNLSGKTSSSLTIDPAIEGDSGTYDVVVTNICGPETSASAAVEVQTGPSINLDPASQSAPPGGTAVFTCGAAGTEPISYQWKKGATDLTDGGNISGATTASLTISPVAEADAGDYSCVATNVCDSATSAAATLSVNQAPVITSDPADDEACEGEAASFTVVAQGSLPISYQWRKGAVDLANGGNISGALSATLTIDPVAAGDAGDYTCFVSNGFGNDTSEVATLTVKLDPTIDTEPADTEGCVGSAVTLSVAASGSGLSYQWRKGGADISGATSSDLTIDPLALDDAGDYDVVVSNDCNSATSSVATLTVSEPPAIDTQPASLEICTGDEASFSVVVSGTGPFQYQWRKNGGDISGATSATYTIAAAAEGDVGSYDVVVTAPCGTLTSSAATLAFGGAPTIDTPPLSQDVCAGSEITLSVAASGFGSITYQWRKGGAPIDGATSSTLTIDPASLVDAGDYDVVVANECGSKTSAVATVTVGDGPDITTQPASLVVCEGESVVFSVVASGFGTLSYQWRKGGSPLSGATGPSYAIASVVADDFATYDVVVTDDCSSATSAAATLSAGAAPTITTQPAGVETCEGEAVMLSAVATGASALSYQWSKDGAAISGATSPMLTIDPAMTTDSGSYVLDITSACGNVTSTPAIVTVGAPTAIVTQPTGAEVCTGDEVVLSVEATGAGTLSYQWVQNGADIPGVTGASYVIAGAATADAGTYEVRVTSDCGTVTSQSVEVTVNTPPVVTADPVSVDVCDGEPASLSVTATGTGLTYQWRIDENPIDGATAATLELQSASLADAGEYDVVVSGTCGEVTSQKAALSIATAPVIDTQPVGGEACPGESLTLSVAASGAEPLSYQWFKDGSEIGGQNAATLSIPTFNPAIHAGTYKVVVENACGATMSAEVDLTESAECGVPFIRGDGNQDTRIDISDAIFTLNYLFRGTASPLCLLALNTNDDSGIDLSDVVYLLNWQFRGGPDLPPPNVDTGCGLDTTPSDSALTCESSACQ